MLASSKAQNADDFPLVKDLQDELGRMIIERQHLAKRLELLEDAEDDEMLMIEEQRIRDLESELAAAVWRLQEMETNAERKAMVSIDECDLIIPDSVHCNIIWYGDLSAGCSGPTTTC